ncbi:MAG: c-type cytochrome [Planctomycetaceae bacterium]|nr:c-type cytochrome [Planctomycetaceae bacterium]
MSFICTRNGWTTCFAAVMAMLLSRPALCETPQVFEKPNLVAWCIVPFDDRERTPEERSAMLDRLGIRKLAYDYRAQHIPTFDAEVEALKAHGIELTAWWFPGSLNDEARHILDVLKKHNVKTQLWVTGSGGPVASPEEQRARIVAEANRIRPIAEAAAEIGCSVGLYNHGGWFGEPENQIAIIEELKLPNVGIVYNQHHGHGHVDHFPELLQKIKPHLYCLNLNGMEPEGDAHGQKILPLGEGSLDLSLLKMIRDSGYTGPIGILNHTQENAEHRLQDNLDGLSWLVAQLDGSKPTAKPKYRSYKPVEATDAARRSVRGGVVLSNKFAANEAPLDVSCRVRLTQHDTYNILVAHATKQFASHWEIFSMAGSGHFTVYVPGHQPDHVRSKRDITDGKWHDVKMEYRTDRIRLFVDGEQVADEAVKRLDKPFPLGPVAIGRLVEGGIYSQGQIDDVTITKNNQLILTWTAPEPQASKPQPYDPAIAAELLKSAQAQGDALRGATVFSSARFACLSCHKIGEEGGTVGPNLSTVAPKRTEQHLVESLLWPKHKVEPEYVAHVYLMESGRQFQGYVVKESDEEVVIRDATSPMPQTLKKSEIEARREIGTLMPEGLVAAMTTEQQRDLVQLLISLRTADEKFLSEVDAIARRSQVHTPAEFAYEKAPLLADHWPSAGEHVNRDRIYDFYRKEALHFRDLDPTPPLLPAFPGLDGGTQGHWGNQSEPTWADGRWNDTVLGSFQAGIFHGDGKTVKCGVCVRLGKNGELAACFDPETLSYPVVWKPADPNKYVTFSDVRHGFMHGLKLNGTVIAAPQGDPAIPLAGKPVSAFKYRGFYRHGDRILFAYRIGEVDYLDAPWVNDAGEFERIFAPAEEHPYRNWTKGGPKVWDWSWTTAGNVGQQKPFAVDTIPLPFENPWNALIFCGGHDFLYDGSALVCTMHGDVWRVTGLDDELKQVTWTRFASGLNHALGLVMSAPRQPSTDPAGVFVQCRDQLTRLHDLNNDGEADFYECFSSAFETSPAGHDFICGLEADSEGRFYTASGNQGLVRISADGSEAEVLATGFRNPDGLGLTSDGLLTIPCSEGDWTPASMICAMSTSQQDNSQPPYFGYPGPKNGVAPTLPLTYIPRGMDNSAGGQIEITGDSWAPFMGNMVHLSFGQGAAFLLLKDEVRGQLQGGLVPLQTEFLSGAHRGRFNHRDGHLYVSGMAGWGSYTPHDGCFQRVRYQSDVPSLIPFGYHIHENGVLLEFAQPLVNEGDGSPLRAFAQCWNYRYSTAYGSPELSPSHFGTPGHDVLPIGGTHSVNGGRAVFIEIPDLQPVNQLHLLLESKTHGQQELFLTVHALDEPFSQFPGYVARQKTIAAHPIETDIALALRSIPNPWLKRNHRARKVTIETGSNLTYATRSFTAAPGEALALTLKNPDVVPHNWALVTPGNLRKVGEEANRLIADPEAVLHQYVPDMPEVLNYTDIVPAGGEFTIWFTAPKEPGRYPYLCTFPGHWMVMNGELIVE